MTKDTIMNAVVDMAIMLTRLISIIPTGS